MAILLMLNVKPYRDHSEKGRSSEAWLAGMPTTMHADYNGWLNIPNADFLLGCLAKGRWQYEHDVADARCEWNPLFDT